AVMGTAVPPLLVIGPPSAGSSIRDQLAPHGFTVEERSHRVIPEVVSAFVAVILDGRGGATAELLTICRRLGLRPLDDRPPLLYLAPDDSAAARLAGFTHGAD